MYGLPAYAWGGPSSYTALSFLVFAATVLLILRTGRELLPGIPFAGMFGAVAASFVIVGHSQSSISNNDIAACFVELVCIGVVLRAQLDRRIIAMLGAACGFAVCIKLTSAPGAMLVWAIMAIRRPGQIILDSFVFGAGFLPLALLWPMVTLYYSGSPLPQFMNAVRLWGEVNPPFPEAISTLSEMFSRSYRLNAARLFTHGMIGLPLLMLALLAAIITDGKARLPLMVLAGYAVLRFLLLSLPFGRADFWFNDRYNMVSYVLLAIGGGWSLGVLWKRVAAGRAAWAPGLLLVLVSYIGFTFEGRYQDWRENGEVFVVDTPSLKEQISQQLKNAKQSPFSPDEKFIQEYLPPEAIVATTTIAPYNLMRRFIQINAVSQYTITLNQSADGIANELVNRGICFLHVPAYTRLNEWLNRYVERWVQPLREICHGPNATVIHRSRVNEIDEHLVCRLRECEDMALGYLNSQHRN